MTDVTSAATATAVSEVDVQDALIAGAGRNKKALTAYFFLRAHAQSGLPFTLGELGSATGWKGQTPKTYATKQWEQLLEPQGQDTFLVKPDFTRITHAQFLRRFTQKKPVYSEYGRAVYPHVVVYEFLLPLTRESQLRDALDQLFYTDTISQRIREIGFDNLQSIVSRGSNESDSIYSARIMREIDERFSGYSIVHVHGRFRSAELASMSRAGDMLATGERYLIDETTAAVRFIVPCTSSRKEFDSSYRSVTAAVGQGSLLQASDVEVEVERIRGMFFNFFVEAVVKTVMGEEEIWLIETTHHGPTLFVWKRQTPR